MALALQCLHASRQAFVVSQQTKIGVSERFVRTVQGGRVKFSLPTPNRCPREIVVRKSDISLFNVRYIDSID